MDEGQPLFSDAPKTFAALRATLSEQRLGTYLKKAGGDETYAFALYLYNARLAGAFLFPLNVSEVTLRNAVDCTLVRTYGEDWPENRNFVDGVLTPESRQSLNTAMDRIGSAERRKLIAGLSFDFWSNLFRREYANLWHTRVGIAFPHLPSGEGKEKIQTLVRDINKLRNRIAHHEHLLNFNIHNQLSNMVELTKLRCRITSDWMRCHTTVHRVMRDKPKASGRPPVTLGDRSDTNFLVVSATDSIKQHCNAMTGSCSAFVCADHTGVLSAFTKAQLANFIASRADANDGMIDLGDHLISEILESDDVKRGWRALDSGTNFSEAVDALKDARTKLIVALDCDTKEPVGIVLRAHRRY